MQLTEADRVICLCQFHGYYTLLLLCLLQSTSFRLLCRNTLFGRQTAQTWHFLCYLAFEYIRLPNLFTILILSLQKVFFIKILIFSYKALHDLDILQIWMVIIFQSTCNICEQTSSNVQTFHALRREIFAESC